MTEQPIIFSAAMVRALMAGRKTQTRRVLKPLWRDGANPDFSGWKSERIGGQAWQIIGGMGVGANITAPCAPGDRLWVREAWRTAPAYDDLKPSELNGDESIKYEADGHWESWGWGTIGCTEGGRYRHDRFMPRWASRLRLHVTDVRVQRLQEISEADARAEGVKAGDWSDRPKCSCDDEDCAACSHYPALYKPAFRHLWNTLHGLKAWDQNPWVAAITFTVQRTLMPRAYLPIYPKETDE